MKDTKEDKKEVRKVCEKCNSAFAYSLADGTLVCRRCSHRTPPKK